jgi:hypothetical protein
MIAQRFIAGSERKKNLRRPEGTIEDGTRIMASIVPTGLTIQTILHIPPAVNCWAIFNSPSGTTDFIPTCV